MLKYNHRMSAGQGWVRTPNHSPGVSLFFPRPCKLPPFFLEPCAPGSESLLIRNQPLKKQCCSAVAGDRRPHLANRRLQSQVNKGGFVLPKRTFQPPDADAPRRKRFFRVRMKTKWWPKVLAAARPQEGTPFGLPPEYGGGPVLPAVRFKCARESVSRRAQPRLVRRRRGDAGFLTRARKRSVRVHFPQFFFRRPTNCRRADSAFSNQEMASG